MKDPIAFDTLQPEMKVMTRLMNLSKKKASVIVRRVTCQHGFEVYRRLTVRFDVQTAGTHLADLNSLMSREWKHGAEELEDDVEN